MKIGTLVSLHHNRGNSWVGVVIKADNDYKYGEIYYVAFLDGDTEWCLREDLEVI